MTNKKKVLDEPSMLSGLPALFMGLALGPLLVEMLKRYEKVPEKDMPKFADLDNVEELHIEVPHESRSYRKRRRGRRIA